MASIVNDRNNRGVLVVIKGKTCGFCKKLTSSLPEIRRRVEAMRINYIEYEVDEMWKPPNGEKGKYPEMIGYSNMWYPFIFYASADAWKDIVAGKDARSQFKILNGVFNNREYSLSKQTYNPLNPDHIIKWLENVASETTITNEVIVPGGLNSLNNSNPQSNPSPTYNQPKIKNEKKMKIVPRRKYGKQK